MHITLHVSLIECAIMMHIVELATFDTFETIDQLRAQG